jgi:hypothetical protein
LRVGRVVFVALVFLGVLLWNLRPVMPELVRSFPTRGEELWVREGGFLVGDAGFAGVKSSKVTFWRWEGSEAWTVRLPKPELDGWRLSAADAEWNGRAFSASPSGQWTAMAHADGAQVRVITWQHGRLAGQLTFPVSPKGPFTGDAAFRILALDDGQALLWLASATVSPILLVKGDRVLATAEHRSKLTVEEGAIYQRSVSPDMNWLIGHKRATGRISAPELECATLETMQGELVVYPYYTIPHIKNPVLFNGAVVGENGAIYRGRNRLQAPDGWSFAPGLEPQSGCAVQYNGSSARVLAPDTGKKWGMPRPRKSWQVAISAGGRFALAYDAAARRSTGMLYKPPSTWSEYAGIFFTPRYLKLYERPGRQLRAMTLPGSRETIESAYLSPDGTRLLLRAVDPGTSKASYLIYRMPPEVRKVLKHR